MKFGKLKNINEINKINFNLPDDVISSNLLTSIKELKSKNVINNVKVYIGAPAWGIKEWEGKIYPKKTPATK